MAKFPLLCPCVLYRIHAFNLFNSTLLQTPVRVVGIKICERTRLAGLSPPPLAAWPTRAVHAYICKVCRPCAPHMSNLGRGSPGTADCRDGSKSWSLDAGFAFACTNRTRTPPHWPNIVPSPAHFSRLVCGQNVVCFTPVTIHAQKLNPPACIQNPRLVWLLPKSRI